MDSFAQLIARQQKEEVRTSGGPYAVIFATPSGSPIWWHYTHADTRSMKVQSVRLEPIRIGMNLFVLAASLVALASLLKNVKRVSLSTLLFGQLLVACFVFLYMEMRPSLRWPASICLLVAPQLVFVILNLRVRKRNQRVHPSTRLAVIEH
jgi:heme/copper-type cytochrome/quinol oxidase subunit 4